MEQMEPKNSSGKGWKGYAYAVATAAACSLLGIAMESRFDPVNIAMVYLLPVVLIALWFSRGAAIVAAVLSVASFGFFFVEPKWAFAVNDAQYLLTFLIMLGVALIISHLVKNIRDEARRRGALEVEAETERIRSALLASISHDLRTPLAIIAGTSSSLVESGDRMSEEDRKALAKALFAQSCDMSEHVAKILEMTRLETGSIKADLDWNSIGDIAGAVLDRLKDKLAKHLVMVDLPSALPLLRVDAALIDQVITNLLENAAKYTPAGTLIRLRAEVDRSDIVVSVEDYGAGLLPEEFKRIFDKFRRGTSEGAIAGTGLGLSICKAIVILHRGRIWAEQLPGGGAAFRFTLPVEAVPDVPSEA
jgi:two-component system sensor histidine kinase KdpD